VPVGGLSAAGVSAGAEILAWLQKNKRLPWRVISDRPPYVSDLWPSWRFYWSVQALRLTVAGSAIELLYLAGQIDTARSAVYAGFSASLLISRLASAKDIGDTTAALAGIRAPAIPAAGMTGDAASGQS